MTPNRQITITNLRIATFSAPRSDHTYLKFQISNNSHSLTITASVKCVARRIVSTVAKYRLVRVRSGRSPRVLHYNPCPCDLRRHVLKRKKRLSGRTYTRTLPALITTNTAHVTLSRLDRRGGAPGLTQSATITSLTDTKTGMKRSYLI